jgi:CheY-like chemotaxis protein
MLGLRLFHFLVSSTKSNHDRCPSRFPQLGACRIKRRNQQRTFGFERLWEKDFPLPLRENPMSMHFPPYGQKNNPYSSHEQPIVLVIDDDPDIVASLARILAGAGYRGVCCHDYDGAIETVKETTPDLILSDINLGGESGLKLCEKIKRDMGMSHVPVIFLSGAQIPDIIRRAHEAGGTYYLRKPFDPQVLLELIDKALWMPHLVDARK